MENIDLETLQRALRFYESYPDGQYDEVVCQVLRERIAQQEKHQEGYWCVNLRCVKCYSPDFRFKHGADR